MRKVPRYVRAGRVHGPETHQVQGDARVTIRVKRVYEKPDAQDGMRVLVDRLWPRGLKKEGAALDAWIKDIAPSNELRKWYHHEKAKWPEFKKRYFDELGKQAESVGRLKQMIASGKVTLLYSSKEEKLNNAVALKEFLEKEAAQ
jgi:uncharacterized protein YeaO (DUF488 family)